MNEFLIELGSNIEKYKEVIMTGIGYVGGGSGVLVATKMYFTSKLKENTSKSDKKIDELKEMMIEMKQEALVKDEVIMDYIKLDTQLKKDSELYSADEVSKFETIQNKADNVITAQKESLINKIKDKAQEVLSKF